MMQREVIHYHWLWFDVERRYKTIVIQNGNTPYTLWFDVERRYKTILDLKVD